MSDHDTTDETDEQPDDEAADNSGVDPLFGDGEVNEESEQRRSLPNNRNQRDREHEDREAYRNGDKGRLKRFWDWLKGREQTDWYDEVVEGNDGEEPDVVHLDPPELKSRLGVFGKVWKQYRHHRKLRRLAGKGYVRWFLVEDSFPAAKFVRPKMNGNGVRELKYDGGRYLFPREAFLADRTTGMWTVVHKAGELDPIPLHEPSKNALSADQAQEWFTSTVSSSAPSLMDRLDIDKSDALMYMMLIVVVFALFQQFMGGGIA